MPVRATKKFFVFVYVVPTAIRRALELAGEKEAYEVAARCKEARWENGTERVGERKKKRNGCARKGARRP